MADHQDPREDLEEKTPVVEEKTMAVEEKNSEATEKNLRVKEKKATGEVGSNQIHLVVQDVEDGKG